MNEFEFTSLTLYNFKISEETLATLTQADLTVDLDDTGVRGALKMGKLLLAPNF